MPVKRLVTSRSVRRSLSLSAAMVVLVALSAIPGSGSAAPAAPGSRVRFGAPVVVNPVHAYGEPDIKIADDGKAYVSGPWGTGTQRSIWNASTDGAQTFLPLHTPPLTSTAQSDTEIPGPGGGDTEISVDHTGKVYYSDLAALASLKFATWDPATKTMLTSLYGNSGQGADGIDRQWFALWDPKPSEVADVRARTGYTGPFPVNYLLFAEALAASHCSTPVLGSCMSAAFSTDGLTYSPPTAFYDITNHGPPVIDQATGTVLQVIGRKNTNSVDVAILTRDPAAPADPSLKNVRIVHVADLPPGLEQDAIFPVSAFDEGRNMYVAWATRSEGTASEDPAAWQVFYSGSRAASGWRNWSPPVQLSSPPANTNLFPWAVAGADGRLAVVWYGSPVADANPSTEDVHQPWDVYLAMVGGADTNSPQIKQYKVTHHPTHYGTICLEGLGCILVQGNRNNADFFYVTVDPTTGALAIVYNDTSNELIQEVPPLPDGTIDHRGAATVMMVKQNGGVGLFGTPVSGPPATGKFIEDPPGDAGFDPVYGTPHQNVPELDLVGLTVRTDGDDLIFRLHINSADLLGEALVETGATAVDYVVRWIGPAYEDPETGTKNPIYYAAAEVRDPTGDPRYFAGEAQSVELCSVSACTPHVINYPAPPQGGTYVTGEVQHNTANPFDHDHIVIRVPRSLVGANVGSLLESLSVFTFARQKTASTQITQAEAESGRLPIMIDGVCCRETTVGP